MYICAYKYAYMRIQTQKETYTQIKWNQLECSINRFKAYLLWLCEGII